VCPRLHGLRSVSSSATINADRIQRHCCTQHADVHHNCQEIRKIDSDIGRIWTWMMRADADWTEATGWRLRRRSPPASRIRNLLFRAPLADCKLRLDAAGLMVPTLMRAAQLRVEPLRKAHLGKFRRAIGRLAGKAIEAATDETRTICPHFWRSSMERCDAQSARWT